MLFKNHDKYGSFNTKPSDIQKYFTNRLPQDLVSLIFDYVTLNQLDYLSAFGKVFGRTQFLYRKINDFRTGRDYKQLCKYRPIYKHYGPNYKYWLVKKPNFKLVSMELPPHLKVCEVEYKQLLAEEEDAYQQFSKFEKAYLKEIIES